LVSGVRCALLENLPKFIKHLSDKVVDETVYEKVFAGFTDEDAFLRELTLKSTLLFAPKLSQRAHQALLKHLSKLQIDEEPAIRANTTILLGNVAGYLAEATAKRVLLNAFTRALRDAFPPARTAGLMALAATTSYYEPGEIAGRVLPAVAPLTADIEKEVRQRAFTCLETFIELMKKHSALLERGPEAAAAAAAADKELRRQKERANVAGGGGGKQPRLSGNVLSWAVNAAAKRIAGGGMDIVGGGDREQSGRAANAEEEAAARGVDMGAKAFSSGKGLSHPPHTASAIAHTRPAKGRLPSTHTRTTRDGYYP
jgi:SCY1-like protein 1